VSGGYTTPEEAARGDIPREYAKVVDEQISPWGEHAALLLETNEPPAVEYYLVVCEKQGEYWMQMFGGNGGMSGWLSDVFVEADWNEGPDGQVTLSTRWDRSGP
jgi:hypothetical protein